jgi:pyruvate formate lyase activating enzyme
MTRNPQRRVSTASQDENHARYGKPFWLRFALVPGLTGAPENIEGIARFCAGLKSLERVEILPFHKLGEYKCKELGYEYRLSFNKAPTPEKVRAAMAIFQVHLHCPVLA